MNHDETVSGNEVVLPGGHEICLPQGSAVERGLALADELCNSLAISGTQHTCLLGAAFEGDLEGIRWHVRNGSNINETDQFLETPLHLAAAMGHVDAVALLLALGADVDPCASDTHSLPFPRTPWWRPLHAACLCNNLEIVKLLLAHGADVHTGEIFLEYELFVFLLGAPDVTTLLIENGFDLDSHGPLALRVAVQHDLACAIELLIRRGVRLPAFSLEGTSALHLAAAHDGCSRKTIQLLLAQRVPVNGRDSLNRTPLHIAALHMNQDAVSTLLENGGDPEARDKDGRTPLDLRCHWAATCSDDGDMGYYSLQHTWYSREQPRPAEWHAEVLALLSKYQSTKGP